MNEKLGPRTSRENEKSLYVEPNTRVPVRLAVNTSTKEKTYGIKKVQTYQNSITASENNQRRKIK